MPEASSIPCPARRGSYICERTFMLRSSSTIHASVSHHHSPAHHSICMRHLLARHQILHLQQALQSSSPVLISLISHTSSASRFPLRTMCMARCVDAAALLLVALYALLPAVADAALQEGFYKSNSNCTVDVEATVASVVQQYVSADPGVGAGLIRLHFHDCFVNGCDASVLIDPSPVNPDPEKGSPSNGGLRGIEAIHDAKRQLETSCPGTVSCADILAFAARDASNILSAGAINYGVPSGRRDGLASAAADATRGLPPPFADLGRLTELFADRGFTPDELVTLSGAHSVGRAHCRSFAERIRPNVSDAMDAEFGARLQRQCAAADNGDGVAVDQDQATPADLDNRYYGNVLAGKVLLNSDWALISDDTTRQMVEANAADQAQWAAKFIDAMRKMGDLDVLTGDQGEIRRFCNVTNSG